MATPGDASELVPDLAQTFFGGNIGNMTLDQIKRRQAVAAAIAAQRRGYPKNLGEGLTSLGEAIGSRMEENRLAAAEAKYRAGRAVDFGGAGLPGSLPGPGGIAPRTGAAPAGTMPRPGGGAAVNWPGPATPRPGGAPIGVSPTTPGIPPGIPGTLAQAQPASSEDDGGTSQDTKDRLALALVNQMEASGGTQANPTVGAAVLPPLGGQASGDGGDIWAARSNAIAGMESGGNYGAVGPPTRSGDRALGKYQVMGANVGPWTEAALGEAMTPAQFLRSPEAQEAVFRHRFGQYVNQFGEEGAARAWFGGPGSVNRVNAVDVNGMSVGRYGQSYLRRLGAQTSETPADEGGPRVQYASLPPTTMSDAGPEPTPTDIQPAPAGPTLLAQLGGGAGGASGSAGAAGAPGAAGRPASSIAGPLTPATLPPTAVPFEGRPLDEGFRIPGGKPVAPEMPPINEYEKRGYALARKYSDDPEALAQAKMLIDYGAKLRADQHARETEQWKADVATWEKNALAEAATQREQASPKYKEDVQKLALERQQAQQEAKLKEQLGGLTAAEYDEKKIKPSNEKVASLPASANAIVDGRRLLEEGIFHGPGSKFELEKARAKQFVGLAEDPRIARTQTFMTNMAPMIASMRSALVGNVGISTYDIQLAERMAGGDPSLSKETLKAILDKAEIANRYNAVQHQKVLAVGAGNDPNRVNALYNANGLPMERYVRQDHVDSLAENPTPERIERFDQSYATPGLARKMLRSRGVEPP